MKVIIKKIKTLIPLLILSFFPLSCQRILDEKDLINLYTSPYMGKWSGNYVGSENGIIVINVAKNGNISGNIGQDSEILYGAVLDNGALLSVISINSAFYLYGSLDQKSGTWKKGELKGSWAITK